MQSVNRSGKVSKLVSLLTIPLLVLASQVPAAADSGPATVHDLTLKDVIRRAIEHNRSLFDIRSERAVQRFSLQVAEDRWDPQFQLSPFASRSRSDRTAGGSAQVSLRVPTGGEFALRWDETFSDKREDSRTRTLSFSQPLLKGAWNEVDSAPVRQARIEDQINVLNLREAAANLIVRVIGSYRSLIAATLQVRIGETSLNRAHEQLDATRALIAAGRVAEREAVHSEVVVANRELALARARNRLAAANSELVTILNLGTEAWVNPVDALEAKPGQGDTNLDLEEVLHSRIDYQNANLRVDIARIKLSLARNNLLPDVSLSWKSTRDDPGRNTDSEVQLNAVIPLNDRTSERDYRSARNELDIAKRGLSGLRDEIGIELRQTINDAEVGFRLTQLARKARELAEENLAIENKKFAQGLSSSSEVASSEDELVRAERDEVDTIISWLDALTRLDRTSGRTLERWGIELEAIEQ